MRHSFLTDPSIFFTPFYPHILRPQVSFSPVLTDPGEENNHDDVCRRQNPNATIGRTSIGQWQHQFTSVDCRHRVQNTRLANFGIHQVTHDEFRADFEAPMLGNGHNYRCLPACVPSAFRP